MVLIFAVRITENLCAECIVSGERAYSLACTNRIAES